MAALDKLQENYSEAAKAACLADVLSQCQGRGFCLQSVSVLRQFMVTGDSAFQIVWEMVLQSCMEDSYWCIYQKATNGSIQRKKRRRKVN